MLEMIKHHYDKKFIVMNYDESCMYLRGSASIYCTWLYVDRNGPAETASASNTG
jgi:hypothetical protein